MTNNKHFFLLILFSLTTFTLWGQTSTFSGSLVNGRGGYEKCDGVKVSLIINSQTEATTTTDAFGAFSLTYSGTSPIVDLARDFSLDQNYPNPFNGSTMLPYQLSEDGQVSLSVYDIRGRKIRSLVQAYHPKGYYQVQWDGKSNSNMICPQGIYFYVMTFKGKTEIKKMSLINHHLNTIDTSPLPINTLSTVANAINIEILIEDKDIENRTITLSYPELPTSLNLGSIPVHVYAYLRESLPEITAMKGTIVKDTLDIYFERKFELSSSDLSISYHFTQDSLVAVEYEHVSKNPSLIRIKEIGESKINYGRAYFTILERLQAWPRQLRRAYVGIPYAQSIQIENSEGAISLTATSTPTPFSYTTDKLHGTALAQSKEYVHFELIDDRNICVKDSALLIIATQENVSFNDYVIDLLEEYHRDGRYPYKWVSGYSGVSEDLYYKGTRIAKANPDSSNSGYCCGMTFEIYFKSIQRLKQDTGQSEDLNGKTASDLSQFISKWFVQHTLGDGPGIALETYGLGEKINKMQDVQKGDFVQIWRTSGSGHSVIFLNWTNNAVGDTTGIRYWSTQTSTQGVNYNTEYFDGYGGTIDKAHTYYSRGYKPEEFK